MTRDQAYSQGYRCGHLEGSGRVGQYVIDEEFLLSLEASDANVSPDLVYTNSVWAAGYREGYRAGASGEPIPSYREDIRPEGWESDID